ncbi:MAG: hypothetical protein AAFP26_14935, partial [Planctomycetota bacterium]
FNLARLRFADRRVERREHHVHQPVVVARVLAAAHVKRERSDDPAQDFSTTVQYATIRADLFGPTALALAGGDVEWQVFAGLKQFTEGDLFGVDRFVQLGTGLRLMDALPLNAHVSLKGVVILGNDLTGFSLGLSLGF